jgi:hypothetical protein
MGGYHRPVLCVQLTGKAGRTTAPGLQSRQLLSIKSFGSWHFLLIGPKSLSIQVIGRNCGVQKHARPVLSAGRAVFTPARYPWWRPRQCEIRGEETRVRAIARAIVRVRPIRSTTTPGGMFVERARPRTAAGSKASVETTRKVAPKRRRPAEGQRTTREWPNQEKYELSVTVPGCRGIQSRGDAPRRLTRFSVPNPKLRIMRRSR